MTDRHSLKFKIGRRVAVEATGVLGILGLVLLAALVLWFAGPALHIYSSR